MRHTGLASINNMVWTREYVSLASISIEIDVIIRCCLNNEFVLHFHFCQIEKIEIIYKLKTEKNNNIMHTRSHKTELNAFVDPRRKFNIFLFSWLILSCSSKNTRLQLRVKATEPIEFNHMCLFYLSWHKIVKNVFN